MADLRGNRQVFVGHPYRLFDMKDYRRAFRTVGKAFGVEFLFADQKITGAHIMDKISDYITDADFSIFDISGWNPNVTLELGLAWGLNRPFFLLMNPTMSKGGDAPSDIKGIDRLDWSSFTELEEQLTKLLAQEYGVGRASSLDDQLVDVRKRVIALLRTKPGLRTEEIANELNVTTPIVKMIMSALVDEKLVTKEGQRRGTKYTLKPTAAKRPAAKSKSSSGARAKTAPKRKASKAATKRSPAPRSTKTVRATRRSTSTTRSTGRRATTTRRSGGWRRSSRGR